MGKIATGGNPITHFPPPIGGGGFGDNWQAIRESIDLPAVATGLLGPATGRRGEKGRRLWWNCPFHEDPNPSFCVDPGKPWWKCYGCDANGDAVALVMKLRNLSFPEAKAYLTGGRVPSGNMARRPAPPKPTAKRESSPPPGPEGMPTDEVLALVAESAERLWTPEGSAALASLHRRGLKDETIRAVRLGFTPPLALAGHPSGVVIPWFAGDVVTLVKLRQRGGRKPKYREVYRDRAHHSGIYPGLDAIGPGRPLAICEGELDALLLGQELAGLAGVVTLGGASNRPDSRLLGQMLAAAPWFVATDNDPAGDKAAAGWPPVARRVSPPGDFKDWTEVYLGGVDLRRWWSTILAGSDHPSLFTWDELAPRRWGPALLDNVPGVIVEAK
jgi:DNA primase